MNTANGGARAAGIEAQEEQEDQQLHLETVLGLQSLSIVLSYLEECDGTSFLLSQKKYWTDTILPCMRLPPEKGNTNSNINTNTTAPTTTPDKETTTPVAGSENSNSNSNSTSNPENGVECCDDEDKKIPLSKPTTPKHRHKFSRRTNKDNHAPIIKFPDASTRLDRLNTRRWNIRQGPSRRPKRSQTNEDGGDQEVSESDYVIPNTTTTRIAEDEWKETVTTTENDEPIADDNHNDNKDRRRHRSLLRHRSIMNPPLLRFYDARSISGGGDTTKHQSVVGNNNEKGTPMSLFQHGTTLLASYPRSGNTLLRSLLETVTGFVTASDTRPDRILSVALAEKPPYFVGEGLAPPLSTKEDRCDAEEPQQSHCPFLTPCHEPSFLLPPPPICKTHWPERIGCHSFDCQRVVLLVRNPFDAVDSYWHMCLTNTHTEKVVDAVTEEHRSFYQALVRHEILQVWMSFLDYYWKECSKRTVPLLLVRYEDLVLSPRDELQRILEFCGGGGRNSNNSQNNSNNSNNNGDDWWKRRLEEVTREEDQKDASESFSKGEKRGDHGGSFECGYRSSASSSDPLEEHPSSVGLGGFARRESSSDTMASSSVTSSNRNSRSTHPSIGRSLRKGLFPQQLLTQIHDFDDLPNNLRRNNNNKHDQGGGGWLERLGYHVYKQGFPNNLHNLPPVPVLDTTNCGEEDNGGSSSNLTINVKDVSLELRPRDSPYGRNMRRWRRKRTANDTIPFPTI